MATQVLEQPDWEIIGFIVSGYIGVMIITPLLLHSVITLKNMRNQMKYTLIISLTSALVFCITIALFRTNVVLSTLDFSSHGFSCILSSGIAYTFYIISKFSMYLLFTYRLQLIFGASIYAVSHQLLKCLRISIIFATAVFVAPQYFTAKQEIITPQFHISLCTNDIGFNGNNISHYIGNMTVVLFMIALFSPLSCYGYFAVNCPKYPNYMPIYHKQVVIIMTTKRKNCKKWNHS
eukprot:551965_1